MADDEDDSTDFFDEGEFETRDDADIWGEVVDDWDDDFEVDADEVVADLENDESEMPGLEDGLHPELIDSLREITKGTGSRHRTSIKAAEPDKGAIGMSSGPAATHDEMTFETFDVEVKHEEANALLKHIYSKLNEAHDKYGHINRLVLGLPQFHVLEPWAQAEHRKSISEVIPPDVIVVPGPVIHPVIDNRVLYTEYLKDKEAEDGE